MADTKISGLSAVTDVQDTDEFVLARSGTTKKIDGVDLRSGVVWETLIDESGSSLANFTTDTGSWSTSGGVISVDATAGAARLAHNTDPTLRRLRIPWVLKADLKIRSDGAVDNSRAGILWFWDGVGDNDPLVRLLWRTGSAERIELENDSVTNRAGADFAWALDTWYTVEIVVNPNDVSVSVDGAFKVAGSVGPGGAGHTQCKVGFFAASSKADFRNLKLFAARIPT